MTECQRQTTDAITSAVDIAWEFSISAYPHPPPPKKAQLGRSSQRERTL